MRMICLRTFALIMFSFVLSSCGGGGGGSGSGSSSGSAATGVRVLHAAIEASPVDLFTSTSTDAIQVARFGGNPFHAGVSKGSQIVTLSQHLNPTGVIYQEAISVERGQHTSLLLYGNTESLGLAVSKIADKASNIPEGKAAIRVIHGMVGAAALNAKLDTVFLTSGVNFGSSSEYVFTEPGIKNIVVRRSVDGKPVFVSTSELLEGKSYSVFMSGELTYLTIGTVLED